MHSSGKNAHKLVCHMHKMKLYSFIFPKIKLRGSVYNDNNKGPRTEPWGMPNRSLQTSDKVEQIFIDR